MDETEELLRLCVRALVQQMIAAPGVELHMTQNCVVGLTNEPLPDVNMLILGRDPDAEGFFQGAVARAKKRGLPLSAMMSPQLENSLAPIARQLGLTRVGVSPLMVLRAGTPVPATEPVKITRALGPELVGVAGDLVAAAFDVPREVVARCIDVGVTETAGIETYIAWNDEGPVSAVTLTPTGNTAGISLMATSPQHQRKGLGRALLSEVIADYRRRGVERFHLGATDAGRPLYEKLGFELVADLSVWILGNQPQGPS